VRLRIYVSSMTWIFRSLFRLCRLSEFNPFLPILSAIDLQLMSAERFGLISRCCLRDCPIFVVFHDVQQAKLAAAVMTTS